MAERPPEAQVPGGDSNTYYGQHCSERLLSDRAPDRSEVGITIPYLTGEK